MLNNTNVMFQKFIFSARIQAPVLRWNPC